ncbi:hypothetical protein ZIOFF_020278 [Zingiber officinale]|uniref:Uncharacterized protein n=1 Tax=Zingiber officinale TaxID=94328 RepID=A0A8J5LIM1_ZINOF|nr:hypothetical protein ZIOFF_020278 [Zingiber officinale]
MEVPVYYLYLNRPIHRNAFTPPPSTNFPRPRPPRSPPLHPAGSSTPPAGPHFYAGIELSSLASIAAAPCGDRAVTSEPLRRRILVLQSAISVIERCRQPVIAAIHGACIGRGVDLAPPATFAAATRGPTSR